MPDLSKIGEREKLKQRGDKEPHWHGLQAGGYVGYRPSRRGGKGSWFARTYDEDAGKYRRKNLGSYGALSGHEVFATAKKDAEAFAELVEAGGLRSEKLETVADACRAYLEDKPGPIAEGVRSEEHTSELQSLMRISYAVFCLNNKKTSHTNELLK